MKTDTDTSLPVNRRNAVAAIVSGALGLGAASSAEAAYWLNQIPTQMSLSLSTTTARRGTYVTATARLTRLDNGAGVQTAAISFYFGTPTYPNSRVGTSVYTDANGYARCKFLVSTWATAGRNIVIAEFTGNNMFAQPLPYAALTIQ